MQTKGGGANLNTLEYTEYKRLWPGIVNNNNIMHFNSLIRNIAWNGSRRMILCILTNKFKITFVM